MSDNNFNRLPYKTEAFIKQIGKKSIRNSNSIPVSILNEVDVTGVVSLEQLTSLIPTWIDEPDANTVYFGYSTDGVKANATTAIYKIVKTGTATEYYIVSGGTRFNQIWNNRASLTYSYKTV